MAGCPLTLGIMGAIEIMVVGKRPTCKALRLSSGTPKAEA